MYTHSHKPDGTHTEKQGKGVGGEKQEKVLTSSFRSDPSQECELEHLHFEGNLKHACKHSLSHTHTDMHLIQTLKTTQDGAG